MTNQVSTPVSTTPTATPDWVQIQADYRAGIKSLRTMADVHGVSHTAISKRAVREGWPRDLTAKTRARADALVYKAAVSRGVSASAAPSELETVNANATLQYHVRMTHRRDIERTRRVWERQMHELDLVAEPSEKFESLGLAVADALTSKERGELVATLKRVTTLSARISSLGKATETLEKLIRLERQAYGIAADVEEVAKGTQGHVRELSDTERAIRLARLFRLEPSVLSAVLPEATATTSESCLTTWRLPG